MSQSLVINHYHSTYIPFNISSIKYTLAQMTANLIILKHMVNKLNNNITTTHFYHISNALNNTYDSYEKLNNNYERLIRKKRGLMNYLGSGIKFITGNLDNDDLESITQNFEILKHNQLNAMHKINDLSSFAGNVMNKFKENINTINENSKTIRSEISNLTTEINLTLALQNQYIQINNLNQYLEKLLRIFSFAHLQTLDLEILSVKEISEIWQYLKIHYPKNTLWSIRHLSELTLICKTGLLITDEIAILVIKIPIFEKNLCDLKIVYPIPNNESKIVIIPSKFYCNGLWYGNCDEINSQWMCYNLIANSCSLSQTCQFAKVQNNYQVHTLTYQNALLFCTKSPETIYEDCFQYERMILQECYLIQSKCDVIVNQHKYSLAINNVSTNFPKVTAIPYTNLSVNLQLRHLEDPKKIQEDLIEPINFQDLMPQPHTHYFIFLAISVSFICTISFVIYKWKKQIKKSIPIRALQKLVNEDVDETKGEGDISLNVTLS